MTKTLKSSPWTLLLHDFIAHPIQSGAHCGDQNAAWKEKKMNKIGGLLHLKIKSWSQQSTTQQKQLQMSCIQMVEMRGARLLRRLRRSKMKMRIKMSHRVILKTLGWATTICEVLELKRNFLNWFTAIENGSVIKRRFKLLKYLWKRIEWGLEQLKPKPMGGKILFNFLQWRNYKH